MEGFTISLKLRIDWSEIDFFGHINNLAIMKYAQSARVQLLEATGLMQLYDKVRMGPIVASVRCQFRKPLFYPGEVIVYSRVESINNTSFEILHVICNEKSEIIAQSSDIIVFFDFNKKSKSDIPPDIREKLGKLVHPATSREQ